MEELDPWADIVPQAGTSRTSVTATTPATGPFTDVENDWSDGSNNYLAQSMQATADVDAGSLVNTDFTATSGRFIVDTDDLFDDVHDLWSPKDEREDGIQNLNNASEVQPEGSAPPPLPFRPPAQAPQIPARPRQSLQSRLIPRATPPPPPPYTAPLPESFYLNRSYGNPSHSIIRLLPVEHGSKEQPHTVFINISKIACLFARSNDGATTVLLTTRLPLTETTRLRLSTTGPAWNDLKLRLPKTFVVFRMARHGTRITQQGQDHIYVEAAINAERILAIRAFDSRWTTLVVEADVRERPRGVGKRVGQGFAAAISNVFPVGSGGLGGGSSGAIPIGNSGVKDEQERGLLSFEVDASVLEVLQLLDADGFPLPQ